MGSIEILSKSGIRDTVEILLNGIWDQDSNYYGTVTIGTQTWLAENLNTGTMIMNLYEPINNDIIEKYCYENNTDICKEYGGMYTWNEMMDYNPSDTGHTGTTRGICPEGWHVPTDWEWGILNNYCGDSAAAKLKEVGTWHWQAPNIATNETGFTALPGGEMYRDPKENPNPSANRFGGLGHVFNFWTSKIEYLPCCDLYWPIEYFSYNISFAGFGRSWQPPYFAESVRCIKDP